MESNDLQPLSLEATQTLIARAQEGDRSSLDELFNRYSPRLLRWATGMISAYPSLRHLAETTDLVQDVLANTYKNLGAYQESGTPFIAYLRRSMKHAIVDLSKKARHRPSPQESDPTVADPTPDAQREYAGIRDLERFEAAFEQLDPEEQAVVHMRFESRYDYDEVAAVLGRPNPDAARAFYSRTMAKLRELMSEGGETAP